MARSSLTGLRRGSTCPLTRWPTPAGEAGRGKSDASGPFLSDLGRGGRRTMGQAERPPPVRTCAGEPGLAHRAPGGLRSVVPATGGRGGDQRPTEGAVDGEVALSALGGDAAQLLRADRSRIWAHDGLGLELDLSVHREALRAALPTQPGLTQDERLALALSQQGTLLEDEPHADWAVGPREALEVLRQDARLALARDRAEATDVQRTQTSSRPGKHVSGPTPPRKRRRLRWCGLSGPAGATPWPPPRTGAAAQPWRNSACQFLLRWARSSDQLPRDVPGNLPSARRPGRRAPSR